MTSLPASEPLAVVEDAPTLYPCLSATFQLQLLTPESGEVLQRANELAQAAFGNALRWQLASFRLGVNPFHPNCFDHVAAYCQRLSQPSIPGEGEAADTELALHIARLDDFYVICKGGNDAHSASPFQYQFWVELDNDIAIGDPIIAIATLRLCFPTDWPLESFERLFRELTTILGPRWATAGLGYSWWYPTHPQEAADGVYANSRRKPGFEVPLFVRNPEFGYFGIPSVNWLTFVGEELLEVLRERREGSEPVLRHVEATSFQHGLLLKAGSAPQGGDHNRRVFPFAYAEIDRFIYPIRWGVHNAEVEALVLLGKWDAETLGQWLGRFEPWWP